MKKILLFLAVLLSFQCYAQTTLIPDQNFENYLVSEGIDTDGVVNGEVATADIVGVTELFLQELNIEDLTGIEDFIALEVLDCSFNLELSSLDISNNIALRELDMQFCDISSMDFSTNVNVEYLYLAHNNLTSLSFTNNPALETLICGNPQIDVGPFNQISSLDLSGAPNVLNLDVSYMFTDINLDFMQVPLLESFSGRYCAFNDLDFSLLENLTTLFLGGTAQMGQSNNFSIIDLENNPNLQEVDVAITGVWQLNLQNGNNTILTEMRASPNDDLYCILVDDGAAAYNGDFPYGNWEIPPTATWGEGYCEMGVEEFSSALVSLYPNPATELLRIDTLDNIPQSVEVYSVEGKLILAPELNDSAIDISSLASGFYVLKIYFDTNFSTATFVKQ
ncbi:MAG: T9SS type A sorting domain-containing protein [Marinirhabdus sp.]|nr:T9SS type A sorting domain-containing protein [Marinirhabdus sp.]